MGSKKRRPLEFRGVAAMLSLTSDEFQWIVDTKQLHEIQIHGKNRVDQRDFDRLLPFYKRVQNRK